MAVSFAPCHEAALITRASVEKSFGAAYRWPLYVNAARRLG